MRQTGLRKEHRILQCVTLMHDVYQPSLSLCRLLCQKWKLFLPSIGVKVNGQYCWDFLLSQQMSDAIIAFLITILCFSKTVHPMHLAFSTVQLLQCKTLNFLPPELWPHNSSELNSTDC